MWRLAGKYGTGRGKRKEKATCFEGKIKGKNGGVFK
jgi:hypothetical protein